MIKIIETIISALMVTKLILLLSLKGVHLHILTEIEWNAKDHIASGEVFKIVSRHDWLAQPPSTKPKELNLPVSRVIVTSTNTESCLTKVVCTCKVRFLQTFHIEARGFNDIAYNFLIGGDGNVYEGRGWDHMAANLNHQNNDSIIIAYIGTFEKQPLNEKQLNITQLFLDESVRLGKLSRDYKIFGKNKIDPKSTLTSTDGLSDSFHGWQHWMN